MVAGEVKALANQTAQGDRRDRRPDPASRPPPARRWRRSRPSAGPSREIDEIASAIAAAVEQQGAATREIAGNVQQAASATGDVHDSVVTLTEASRESGTLAASLLAASNGLTEQSRQLKLDLDSFLASLRAA